MVKKLTNLSETDREILERVRDRYLEPADIEPEVEASESTVYRRLEELSERNLVEEKDLSGSSAYRASSSAKMLLDT